MVNALHEPRTTADVRAVLEDVRDPEIPILTIADLGILRDVALEEGEFVIVSSLDAVTDGMVVRRADAEAGGAV